MTELQKIINRMAKIAFERVELSQQIDAICVERYGCTYSEIDCDGIIDVLDFGGGSMSEKQFDAYMIEAMDRIK